MRHHDEVHVPIFSTAFQSAVVGDWVILGVTGSGELCCPDGPNLDQHTSNVGGADRGEFPVGIGLCYPVRVGSPEIKCQL